MIRYIALGSIALLGVTTCVVFFEDTQLYFERFMVRDLFNSKSSLTYELPDKSEAAQAQKNYVSRSKNQVEMDLERDRKRDQVVNNFITLVRNRDKKAISELVHHYPLERNDPLLNIKTKENFVGRYDEIFDEKLYKEIINHNANEWTPHGWRGIYSKSGGVILNYDGTLSRISHHSEEENILREMLIRKDRETIYQGLRGYVRTHEFVKDLEKGFIRIDEIENNRYRLTQWKPGQSITEEPFLVRENGGILVEGSGGYVTYIFLQDDTFYLYHPHWQIEQDIDAFADSEGNYLKLNEAHIDSFYGRHKFFEDYVDIEVVG